MATVKKIVKKAPPKKVVKKMAPPKRHAPPKKVIKKAPPKAPPKRPVVKAAPPRKVVKKAPPPKKPVVKAAPPRKLPGKPVAVVKKPVVKAAPPKAPKAAKPKAEPVSLYRKLRKYTTAKIEPLLAAEMLGSIRQRIRSPMKGALLASELLKYLKAIEVEMTDWNSKKPDPANPKRRGRPASTAPKKTAPLRPVANATDVIAQAKAGTLLQKKPVVPTTAPPRPVVTNGVPLRVPFRLVRPGAPA